MSVFPEAARILKGAFFRYDGAGTPPKIIVFPYNPETLTRTILPAIPGAALDQPGAAGYPRETIEFTLPLDATDSLEQADAQAIQTGIYPWLSAIELLMYPSPSGGDPLTLFVWGQNRILPVRVIGLKILERLFDANLSPIQALVQVTLLVASAAELKDFSDLPQPIATLKAMAALAYSSSTIPTGVTVAPVGD
jgi:hypothetical protein